MSHQTPEQAHDQATSAEPLRIEWWPLERLRRYARNPRVCPQEAIDGVAASIASFGWKVPLVVSHKGSIITGHTRYEAALKLGLGQVPVIVADDLSKAQQRAYRIADNKLAEATSWNEGLLAEELAALVGMEIDPALCGFSAEELSALLAPPPSEGLCDPDEVVSPPEAPVTQLGDLWTCGTHRLLCGDATEPEDVRRLMNGRRASLMATDPPYLVDYDGGHHPATEGNGGKAGKLYEKAWDAYKDGEHSTAFYAAYLRVALEEALTEAPAVYQWFAITRVECVLAAWREAGLLAHQTLIWKKSRAVLTYSDYLWDYEPFLYGWKMGKRPELRPPADARTVWEVESKIEDAPGAIHPTIKPVELVRRPLEYHTRAGGVIYEPFCGSGTALIAAEMTGRACCALELSPAFVDAAVLRWERFTGRAAVREGAS